MMRTSFGYDSYVPNWFNDLQDGIVLVDAGYITHINTVAGEMLDVDPNRVTGMSVIAVVRDHRLEKAYLEGDKITINTRGRVLKASGIRGGLYLQDITSVCKLEENTRELLAVLSHELRTPVTTIQSTLEALHYDLPPEQQKRFLERAQEETKRLQRLLEDLTIDVKPPQARSINIADITQRALSVLQPVLEKHNVIVQTQLEPLTVWADPDKFLQVLINLIENAAVHGPNDSTVSLHAKHKYDINSLNFLSSDFNKLQNYENQNSCQMKEAEDCFQHKNGEMAYIYVQDTGKPLPKENIVQLFEPHTQGRQSNKGTGLGLYIIKSIATRANGTAWGKPLAEGNEFGICLPLSKH